MGGGVVQVEAERLRRTAVRQNTRREAGRAKWGEKGQKEARVRGGGVVSRERWL